MKLIPTVPPPSTHAVILTTATPAIAPPIVSPSPVLEWGIVLGAVGYFGKWALEQFSNKEKSESDLMKSLIINQQEIQNRLIQDSKEAKLELIEQIALKDTVTKGLTQMQSEVIRSLQSQVEIQASYLKGQEDIQKSLDAIHEVIVQLIQVSPACPHESRFK